MVVLAGLATLGVAALVASQIGAQGPAAPPAQAPASVKVGLVNLAYVFKGYNRYKSYSDEMERLRVDFEKKATDIQKRIKDCQDYMNNPAAEKDKRDKMPEYVTGYKRQLEDLSNDAKAVLGKKSDQHMIQCYREIEEAVKRYAAANGFHAIFSYSEALTEADRYSAPDIQRKITGPFNSAGVTPLYFVNGMDVSAEIVSSLNTMFPAPAAAAPATAPAAGGATKN
jgi:outer membrane protein